MSDTIEFKEPEKEINPYEFNPKPVEEVTEEPPVEEAPVAEEAPTDSKDVGPLGLQRGETDGEVDPGKPLTTPIDRAVNKIPIVGSLNQGLDAASQGVGDFIFDAANATRIPWLVKANNWWDGHNPKSKDPTHTLIRDVSAVVVPSLIGGAAVGSIGKATAAKDIPAVTRTLSSIAAQMGIEVGIAGITSQSYEQDNAAGALNKMFGWNLPWATEDGMDPDKRRHLHMYEAGAFSAGVDLIQALAGFGNKLRKVNLDIKAQNLLEQDVKRLGQILEADGLDQVTEAVEGTRATRKAAQEDETFKRLTNKTDTEYDPFLNEPARVEQRAVDPDNFDIDPVGAKADLYKIQNNIGTIDGIARPFAPPRILDELANSNITDRAKALGDFFDSGLSANADIIIDEKTIKSADLNKAVDNLVENLFDPGTSFTQFKNSINLGKTRVLKGRKFLNDEAWVKASAAWQRAHRELFDPNNLRASAVLQQQAANTVSTTARSLNLLDGIGTSGRQWEIMSKKMKFLVGEVTASRSIIKSSVEMKELVRGGDFRRLAEWLQLQSDGFDVTLGRARQSASDVIDEIERIAIEHPNYMRPLAEAYDATNGDVDTLYKLHKWGEANIGLLKKGIIDRNPEMPSFFIRGLQAIRYNSILNGLAPVRALTGNSIIATVKPISVLTGAMATGDVGTFKRALYTYGGFSENFKRGLRVMGDDWRRANSNPQLAVKRGRKDFKMADMEKFQAQATLAETWRREGKEGKVAMWNVAAALTHWNNWNINRWGINALYGIDGFFKSLMASGSSRATAYDTLLEATNGSFTKAQFQDLQRHLYDNAFDNNGLLRDSAAEFATKELALNIDYRIVDKFEHFMGHVPAAKPLFMFPRTGINALELTWSFNPASNLGPAITRARRTLAAETAEEIAEVLAEHGLENTPEAFKALQSEYIGRQLMGTTVIMGAGMWALEGNLTGNGPQDDAERRRMMAMGWQPLSIKNPITGKWHSYQGFEPFQSVLSMTADIIYQADRVDQSITEDLFRKVLAAITMNTTNNTFTSGFEPLVSMFSGAEYTWNRFLASTLNTSLPQAGVRTILNNIITPQLKDVKNDMGTMIKNMNKFMFPDTTEGLPDMIDIYTGQPIKYYEGLTAAANALTPFFKQNGGMEPWRQWLLSTGWDGLSKKGVDPISGEALDPHARQWINNWIGQHGGLKGQIIEMMEKDGAYWNAELKAYKKGLGLTGTQQDTPIKQTLLHRELDVIHDRAFEYAIEAYERYLRETSQTHELRKAYREEIKGELRQGNTEEAFKLRDELLQYK